MMPIRIAPARRLLGQSCGAHSLPLGSMGMRQPLAFRLYSSGKRPPAQGDADKPSSVTVRGTSFRTDPSWFNVPPHVLGATSRQLHLQRDHPISITRQIIESHFPQPTYRHYNEHNPVVSTHQNFDSLGFPAKHPGRARTDTYYINETALLRTHTSAHQAETFRANESDGYLISADVYRRDAIDRTHYPVFHQIEGARSWDRTQVPNGDVAAAVRRDIETLPKHHVQVEDPNPSFHAERNPLQEGHHSAAEAEAIGDHLKRSLENMVVDVFTRTNAAAVKSSPDYKHEPLQMRWVEASFPFTSPSWELEVYHEGKWLEVLGCGVVKQEIYVDAGVPSKLGWAFGIGIERIAMLLFNIPDIRIFWSHDKRFLRQFRGVSDKLDALKRFEPFSKHPPCPKDISFWLPSSGVDEKVIMELVRGVAGDKAEDVKLIDRYTDPKTGRKSVAYRIVYRSLERTLTNPQAKKIHDKVTLALTEEFGVMLR